MQEECYVLWLTKIEGIGKRKIAALVNRFGCVDEIRKASVSELTSIKGINESMAEQIISYKDEKKIEKWVLELEERGIHLYSILNSQYPKILKEIYDPPSILYVRGIIPEKTLPWVSIIGTRRCTQYGAQTAFQLSKELAEKGIVIVSGMARGIDSMAHKGALEGGGKTVAVLGNGVDICYPSENRELMKRIIKNGCVMSEYSPKVSAVSRNFPVRNRIISGLSEATMVVEAGQRSGSLITVDHALNNGREVFAVPGNINSLTSKGTNNLIQQGCLAVTSSDDVLFGLGITCKEEENTKNIEKKEPRLAGIEKSVYDCINLEPVGAEEIARKLNQSIQEIHCILSILEISKLIIKLPQSGYIRIV